MADTHAVTSKPNHETIQLTSDEPNIVLCCAVCMRAVASCGHQPCPFLFFIFVKPLTNGETTAMPHGKTGCKKERLCTIPQENTTFTNASTAHKKNNEYTSNRQVSLQDSTQNTTAHMIRNKKASFNALHKCHVYPSSKPCAFISQLMCEC